MEMSRKVRSEAAFTEVLAERITVKVNKRMKKDGLELMKMKLGFEVLFINLSKFALVFAVAAVVDLLKQTVFMCLVFASIRRSSFGLHAKSSLVCTVTSLTMFVFGSYVAQYIRVDNYIVVVLFSVINVFLYLYSPADTENHPLLSQRLRKKLKRDSVVTGMVLMLLALVIQSQPIKVMIILAASYETVGILPITYKLLNRRYKNYEKFERTSC